MQLGLVRGDALNGEEDEKEDGGEDCESLRRSRLSNASVNMVHTCFGATRTTTPWTQAKMTSSYRRVTRSQRAVE